jgi:hypothetical protein
MVDRFGPVLLSRADGARAREAVCELFGRTDHVRVDFSDVEVISPGFADEFFARMPDELLDSGWLVIEHLSPRFGSLHRLVVRRAANARRAAPAA